MLLAADTRPSFLTERGDAYTPGVGSGRPVECCCRRTFKGGSRDCLFMLFAAGSLLPRPDRMAYMIEDGTRLYCIWRCKLFRAQATGSGARCSRLLKTGSSTATAS